MSAERTGATPRARLRTLARNHPVLYRLAGPAWRAARRVRGRGATGAAVPSPLRGFGSLLPPGASRTVVLLAQPDQRRQIIPWFAQFRGDRLHVMAAGAAPEWADAGAYTFHAAGADGDIARELKPLGPVDVIVDLRGRSVEEHQATWQRVFFHLAPQGAYILDRSAVQEDGFRTAMSAWVQRVATADDVAEGTPSPGRSYADATASVTLSRDLFILKKRHKHYLKLRDAEVAQLLPAREPAMRVSQLDALPGGEVVSKAVVTSHEADVAIPWLPERMTYPALHLRHYQGRIGFIGQTLTHTESSILPESFRWHLEPNPRNPKIKSVSPTFARIPDNLRPKRTLEGNFYQLDPQGTGHFGHIMTETVGRLWGWDEAKQRIPDLKALFRTRKESVQETVEYRLFRAYGIAEEDIVAVRSPVFIDSLVAATAMWHNADPHHAHPDLVKVWERIGRGLIDPNAPAYERVFVSRSDKWWRRGCRNVKDVEALFEAHGFQVIYPEHLDLGVQAGIFAAANVIAGFGGSAMFNVMFAKNLKTMILLSHEAYTARNEHLYTSLLGGSVHYFWSPPDIPHPVGGWSQAAFDCNWEFDFGRNQGPLEELFASL